MTSLIAEKNVDAVREFNRFYTRQLGLLDEQLLDSGFSLTEARILFELGLRSGTTSAELKQHLSLDAGYLSRVIASLEKRGQLEKSRSGTDARAYEIRLTQEGQSALNTLVQSSRASVCDLLEPLGAAQRDQLIGAMAQIQTILNERDRSYVLRDPRPGDMGLVVQQQAALYSDEYG